MNLKPCPFCGGEVTITYCSEDNMFSIWHKDDKCKFIEPLWIYSEYAKSLSDAQNIWNNRNNELLKEQPIRCKECSYHRKDGWCNEHGREVKETDFCSFGAWEGR